MSEIEKERTVNLLTIMELIQTGSLIFENLDNPGGISPMLSLLPGIKKKLRVGNMMLTADFFYALRYDFAVFWSEIVLVVR